VLILRDSLKGTHFPFYALEIHLRRPHIQMGLRGSMMTPGFFWNIFCHQVMSEGVEEIYQGAAQGGSPLPTLILSLHNLRPYTGFCDVIGSTNLGQQWDAE